MKNTIKNILISQLSFPLKYKNKKEIWWEDKWGDPITIEIINIENEQYVVRRYYGSGQLMYEVNYCKEQRNGQYLSWYGNGQMRVKANYHQEKLHKECSLWYINGRQQYKLEYNYGKLINEEHY